MPRGSVFSRGSWDCFEDLTVEDKKGVKKGKIIVCDIFTALALLGNKCAPKIPVHHDGDLTGRCRRIQIETLCVARNGNYKKNSKLD